VNTRHALLIALLALGCTSPEGDTAAPSEAPVLLLGLMVHLEGWDLQDQALYAQYVTTVDAYVDVFEAHGAKLTLENSNAIAASAAAGDDFLVDLERRGHTVGVHADLGGGGPIPYSQGQFALDLTVMKDDMEDLGVAQVRHVSGVCSELDWVTAALDAGFEFITGNVGYCAMSLPVDDRPEAYRDCENAASCHGMLPEDVPGRLHPWRARDGATWLTPDPDGSVVILPSSSGIHCQDEDPASTAPCEYTDADIDAQLAEMEDALGQLDPDQLNTWYLSWSLGMPIDPTLLDQWLTRVDAYVADGTVQWSTIGEMYDAYLATEAASSP
jgi:hypothetical protein